MSSIAVDVAHMVDMLPEKEQRTAYEVVKEMVKAWDPDFVKVTPNEAKQLQSAENGEFFSEGEIDWTHLDAIV